MSRVRMWLTGILAMTLALGLVACMGRKAAHSEMAAERAPAQDRTQRFARAGPFGTA